MLQIGSLSLKAVHEKQIAFLKIVLQQDIRKKDKQVHRQALEDTEKVLREIERG